MANRHGLISGATGTGKTVTLQLLAESFSAMGVPVFLADVKGDLAGISQPGGQSPKVQERLAQLKIDGYTPAGCPVTFWDVFGEKGHPVRATISEMGPLLLARLLQLNDTQAGVLNIVFRVADENGLLLLDLKDLRAMLQHVGDNAAQFTTQYGNISPASIGAIQRGLADARIAGRGQILRRTRAEPRRFHPDGCERSRRGEHSCRRQAAAIAPRLRDAVAVVVVGVVRAVAGGWRCAEAEAGFLLRRGASVVQRDSRPRCWRRSSRSCGSCAPKASAFISSRRTRAMCRTTSGPTR
jgi:hypothetical protein